jgi:small subunit ribosomal protein S4
MAKYIGPKSKIARKFGEPIFGPDKHLERKNFPPGQHGLNRKRKKLSVYGLQLREKQKVKATYGILERQFRNIFEKASRSKGVTGEVLLQLLESRLDNVVYRLSLSKTRAGARQLILHGHIMVNGKIVNIPSVQLKPGDIISVRERSKSLQVIEEALSLARYTRYSWLEWDSNLMAGKFMNIPQRSDIPENIKEHLIVELYSK